MARINNWSLIAKEKADYIINETLIKYNNYPEGKKVRFYERLVPWGTKGACVIGVSSGGKEKFEGECIRSSEIVFYGDGYVKTASGSVYELGEKSADYTRYEEALENNVPVITNWTLAPIYSNRSNNLYFMQGKMNSNDKCYAFIKEVKRQNLDSRMIEFADGTMAFIDYTAINPRQRSEFSFMISSKIIYKENKFCDVHSIIIFDNVDWYMHGGTIPVEEELLLKYRKDAEKEESDDDVRYLVISADDMAKDMNVTERMAVAKEVEA